MNFKSIISYFLLSLLSFCTLTSCIDEIEYPDGYIPEGEGNITATISFTDLFPTQLGGSRSSGTAIEVINNLFVAIYDTDTTLVRTMYLTPGDWIPGTNEDMPGDIQDKIDAEGSILDQAQPKTPKVQFNIENIPFGRYYIYVAANVGNLSTKKDAEGKELDISTPYKLKKLEYEWKNDVSLNNQMFGYFTYANTEQSPTNETSNGFNAPLLTLREQNQKIHAWIKRLASKVTVAFDGIGLHQNIYVYIHNVSIRQIPLACRLGIENHPGKDEVTGDYFDKSEPTQSQVLYYSTKGITETATDYNPSNYKSWLTVAKGTRTDTLGCNHDYRSPALYFYENMQGNFKDHPNKKWYDKNQDRDSVGTGIGTEPGKNDYRDNRPYGTFIEIEAYYKCDTIPVSYGAIRYRFMLGQDTDYDYNAIRNHHYKVTLGFNGYANQPDWHIEYKQNPPAAYTPEVYIPYTYNTSVEYPVTFRGNITGLTAEIIENNWAPYDEMDTQYEVAPEKSGSTNFDERTLEFIWWRDVFINSSGYNKDVNMQTATFDGNSPTFTNSTSNYFYGRHPSQFYHLDENGEEIKTEKERYYVTPIWAGFLRLQEPEVLAGDSLPAAIIRNLNMAGTAAQYGGNATGRPVLTRFRNYYYGKNFTPMPGDDDKVNTTDLHKRVFSKTDLATTRTVGSGRNSYRVIKSVGNDGVMTTTVVLKLWTQPKSMCGISGFSGNNPYEDYNRKAVIRFTASFENGETVTKDATVLQSKRITNPKGVWRAHANPDKNKDKPDPFNVILYQRDQNSATRNTFNPMISQGEWRATIKKVSPGDDGFISLSAGSNSTGSGDVIYGNTLSPVNFTINFARNIPANQAKCAIIEVRYHGNTCVHNIFVRQGFDSPIKVMDDGPYWSSYNLYSADADYAVQSTATGTLTCNPLLFGAYFKRGNYRRAIAVSNISSNQSAFGPLKSPGSNKFTVTGDAATYKWSDISGRADKTFKWATFRIGTKTNYTVPTIAQFQTLLEGDFGVGVMYGDGATAPATTTTDAFGFMDHGNTPNQLYTSHQGMRGYICYNPDNAHQIFFPIGTTGMGRRTIQGYSSPIPEADRGTLRYGSVDRNFDKWAQATNSMRPIPMNMENAPGSAYWVLTGETSSGSDYYTGWDMNYFDLNFNGLTNTALSISIGNNYAANGDAIPIRLVSTTPN